MDKQSHIYTKEGYNTRKHKRAESSDGATPDPRPHKQLKQGANSYRLICEISRFRYK